MLTNGLIYEIDKNKFKEKYDVVYVKTSDNDLKLTKILQNEYSKSASVYHSYGKCLYALYKKDAVDLEEIRLKINDKDIEVGYDVFLDDIIILNLLINSYNNFKNDNLSFDNLVGKLYIYNPAKKTKNKIEALNVSIAHEVFKDKNSAVLMKVSSTSFLKFDGNTNDYKSYFVLSAKDSLRNATYEEIINKDKPLYVHGNYKNKKTTARFYEPSNILDRATAYQLVMNYLKNNFNDFLRIEYRNIEEYGIVPSLKNIVKVKNYISSIKNVPIKITSLLDNENDYTHTNDKITYNIEYLKNKLKEDGFKLTDSSRNHCLNIVILHEPSYYEGQEDPYNTLSRNYPTQCITIESLDGFAVDDDNKNKNSAMYYVCLIELAIKNDIINNKKITIDNWSMRNFGKEYFFGTIDSDKMIVLKVDCDGNIFETIDERNLFNKWDWQILKRI